jgi:ADP-heptose:LPS heptosyltransferase
VLRALGLGDLLTGVPALRALRRGCPEHEIVLAAPGALEPLVRLVEAVDRLVDTHGLADLPWPGGPPELAVNLHGRGPQSHTLLQALDPGRLVAYGCPAAGHPGPAWDDAEHERRRWCRLLEETLGLSTEPDDLRLGAPEESAPAPGAVVVHPGAAYPSRRWPPDRFSTVARRLTEEGYDVVVTGGPDEVALAEQVARGGTLPPDAVLAGRTDLGELAAQVAAAPLVLCGDTGVAHLATAFGTPSVLLFGPMPPERWGPPASGPHTVIWHGAGVGDPWADRVDPALLRIGVEEVVARSLDRLEAGRETGSGTGSRPLSGPGPGSRTTPSCA